MRVHVLDPVGAFGFVLTSVIDVAENLQIKSIESEPIPIQTYISDVEADKWACMIYVNIT